MEMKTSELTGAALDWAVAKCEFIGTPPVFIMGGGVWLMDGGLYHPASDWGQGGPIIARERIELKDDGGTDWLASHNNEVVQFGPTPLIAAMRCFVASKLGDAVYIPDTLIG